MNRNFLLWLVFILVVLGFVCIITSSLFIQKEVCEDFGGKLTGELKCYKAGVIYEIVSVNLLGCGDYRIAKNVVKVED
jgi:hypothetical protein